MRIWSLHPSYLDAKGLVALWRETLLARKVLLGETRGYRNHPQLIRFKATEDPVGAIDRYLSHVLAESEKRGYRFDPSKIGITGFQETIPVTEGQLVYELIHLGKKLEARAPDLYPRLPGPENLTAHPLFSVVPGGIEVWEKR